MRPAPPATCRSAIASMSSSVSAKSKTAMVLRRSAPGVVGLRDHDVAHAGGASAARPAPGVRPSRSATAARPGRRAAGARAERAPRLGGDAVRGVQARSSCCCRCGCSSIWLTAGTVPPRSSRRCRCARAEVGDADRAGAALGEQLLQRVPGLHALGQRGRRPVDEVEVDEVQAELLQAAVERRAGVRRTPWSPFHTLVVTNSSSRGMPDAAMRAADALLVAVDRGGVDAAVALLEGLGRPTPRRRGPAETPKPSWGMRRPLFRTTVVSGARSVGAMVVVNAPRGGAPSAS